MMGRNGRALWLLAVLLVADYSDVRADAGRCRIEGEMLACELQPSRTTTYELDGVTAKSLKLRNSSPRSVQLIEARVRPALPGRWGEYCVTLRDLSMHQKEPGFGEVGCAHKSADEAEFVPLRWGGQGAGLEVPPGVTVFLGGYVHGPDGKDHRKSVQMFFAQDAVGMLSYRQPREDAIIRCHGASEATVPGPWRNDTGGSLVIRGATIFAADAEKNDAVDSACIEVRGSNGTTVKWRHCEGIQRRGEYRFGPAEVLPGDFIAGQAHNRCAAGQWDWAAYIHVCRAVDCLPPVR